MCRQRGDGAGQGFAEAGQAAGRGCRNRLQGLGGAPPPCPQQRGQSVCRQTCFPGRRSGPGPAGSQRGRAHASADVARHRIARDAGGCSERATSRWCRSAGKDPGTARSGVNSRPGAACPSIADGNSIGGGRDGDHGHRQPAPRVPGSACRPHPDRPGAQGQCRCLGSQWDAAESDPAAGRRLWLHGEDRLSSRRIWSPAFPFCRPGEARRN